MEAARSLSFCLQVLVHCQHAILGPAETHPRVIFDAGIDLEAAHRASYAALLLSRSTAAASQRKDPKSLPDIMLASSFALARLRSMLENMSGGFALWMCV